MKRLAVIGGGISGLAAAYMLQKELDAGRNLDYMLLEAGDRLGGVIVTEKINGFLIEGGPDCFISTKPQVIQLANELGIGDQLINSSEENRGTYIYSDGTLHELPDGVMTMVPTKLGPFLKTDLISWPGKLRAALDLVIPRKRNGEEESVAQFVTRRLGKEILDKIAEPLVGGIHASDPETMSLESTFPRFIEMEKEYGSLIKGSLASMQKARQAKAKTASKRPPGPRRTFFVGMKGGLQQLTDMLASRLQADRIMTGTKVESIRKQDGGYLIHLADRKPILADAIVLATPAFASAQIVGELDKSLAGELDQIPYVDAATISLGFNKADLKAVPRGYGVIVPLAANRRLMAATWSSNKWANRAEEGYFLVRGFVGGSRNQQYVDLDDQALIDLVREELKIIAGIEAEPHVTRIFRWRKGMAQYTMGHTKRVAEIQRRCSSWPGLFLAGNAYHGVGLSDCIKHGQEAAKAASAFLLDDIGAS